jgi:triosephosphate isomerase
MVNTALEHDMTVIFLLWRRIKDRQSENHFNVVETNCRWIVSYRIKDWESIVLAYEPVWAMGQEKQLLGTSTEMHEFIRETFEKLLEVTLLKAYLSFTAEA